MKTAAVWILLALLPVANLQMICVDHGGGSGGRESSSSSAPECTEFCLRAEAPSPPVTDGAGCVLLAGGCSLLAALVVALPERWPPLAAPVAGREPTLPIERTRYLWPALQKLTPPPKA